VLPLHVTRRCPEEPTMTQTTTTAVLSDLLTARELAERWGCSVGHLANLRSAGLGLAYIKLVSSVRYRVSDLPHHESAHTVSARAPATALLADGAATLDVGLTRNQLERTPRLAGDAVGRARTRPPPPGRIPGEYGQSSPTSAGRRM
jgi:hypothetical protein